MKFPFEKTISKIKKLLLKEKNHFINDISKGTGNK